MTSFAADAGRHLFQVELAADDAAGRVTTEAIAYLIFRQAAAKRFLERFRNVARRANRKVQTLNLVVVTDKAFIKSAFVLKHVSLSGLALSESVEDGQSDCLLAIRHRINALFFPSLNLVSVRAAAKGHVRVFDQYFGIRNRFHGYPH